HHLSRLPPTAGMDGQALRTSGGSGGRSFSRPDGQGVERRGLHVLKPATLLLRALRAGLPRHHRPGTGLHHGPGHALAPAPPPARLYDRQRPDESPALSPSAGPPGPLRGAQPVPSRTPNPHPQWPPPPSPSADPFPPGGPLPPRS